MDDLRNSAIFLRGQENTGYLAFTILFALFTGWIVDLAVQVPI